MIQNLKPSTCCHCTGRVAPGCGLGQGSSIPNPPTLIPCPSLATPEFAGERQECLLGCMNPISHQVEDMNIHSKVFKFQQEKASVHQKLTIQMEEPVSRSHIHTYQHHAEPGFRNRQRGPKEGCLKGQNSLRLQW